MAMLDAAGLRDFLDTRFPQVAAQFAVDAAGEGTVTLRLIADGSHLRPGGTVSGPAIFALADVGAWLAVLTLIGPVEMAQAVQAVGFALRDLGIASGKPA